MPTEQEKRQIKQAVEAWRPSAGNDLLDALGIEEFRDRRVDRNARFARRLELLDDEQTAELLHFLEPDRELLGPWEPGFKLFVSHVAASVAELLPLTERLESYGIIPFLAHKDINPGQRWHEQLVNALDTMDALLSFHSNGFAASPWCGQEIGFALGRKVTVVPVRAGEDPSGFVAQIQAIRWQANNAQAAADLVVKHLRGDRNSAELLGNALARGLKYSSSYDRSDFLVAESDKCRPLTKTAQRDIELALKFNDQVRGRRNAESLLDDQD